MTSREMFVSRIAAKMAKHYDHVALEPGQYTIGAFVSAVMEIDNEEDAHSFYEGNVESMAERPDLKESPESVVRANIGWCFGEGMDASLIAMWQRVCGAAHPILQYGSNGSHPSAAEAFAAGVKVAQE